MHELCFVFEQVIDSPNDIPLSEHHLIIKGHKFVLHVSLYSMYDSVIKQGIKQLGRNVSSVCKALSIQVFDQNFPYLWIPVINIFSCKTECYGFSSVFSQQMKFKSYQTHQ